MLDEKLRSLQNTLGYTFHNLNFLIEATTHKSFLNEFKNTAVQDNERLEFLGDAVLNLMISEYLIRTHPDQQEGELSKRKARIVSEAVLAKIARELALGNYLRLGRGEEMSGGRKKNSLLANTLEAIIAAIYLDGGIEKVGPFILSSFKRELEEPLSFGSGNDYKTELQELSQKLFEILPVYKVIRETGPDHRKSFEVALMIKGVLYGLGKGPNKKEAEQMAAQQGIKKLGQISPR